MLSGWADGKLGREAYMGDAVLLFIRIDPYSVAYNINLGVIKKNVRLYFWCKFSWGLVAKTLE